MVWGLPDFQATLTSFYDEKIKPTIESKSSEFQELIKENMAHGQNTQKAIVAILLAVLLLLALAFFWKDAAGIQWKYLALGSLIGYVVPYVVSLRPQYQV